MNKWFKMLCVITGLMLIAALAGCTQTNRGTPNSGATGNQNKTITLSAAVSLKEALTELQKLYAQKNPRVKLNINFGSSGALQQQIEEGAPVDAFISAGKRQMDGLEKQGLIDRETRKDILGNELVLVVAKGKETQIKGFNDLSGEKVVKISIGTPETVPAGKYAQETLSKLGLWEKLQDKLVLAKDVRQVLTYVDTGNVDAGLVYESDARALKNGMKAATAPDNTHQPIVYPAAVIKDSKAASEARDFLNFLTGPEAAAVFKQYGFKPLLGK